MKIRIATWNMAYWQYKKYFEEAWDYYLREIDADIIFFQEARPSKVIENDKEHLVWNEISSNRPWGSGVYSKNINGNKQNSVCQLNNSVTFSDFS